MTAPCTDFLSHTGIRCLVVASVLYSLAAIALLTVCPRSVLTHVPTALPKARPRQLALLNRIREVPSSNIC
jgi:hypothetical protein